MEHIARLLHGRLEKRPQGVCLIREETMPLRDLPGLGRSAHERMAEAGAAILSVAGGRPAAAWGLLDAEATGFGGAGTVAFLVGTAWVDDSRFHVRQFLLPDYSHEPAFLSAVADELRRFSAVVTFNGCSYDLPLLQERSVYAQRPLSLEVAHHVDLLPLTRQLYSALLPSCRLASVERDLLGIWRVGDVPSDVVPGLYFTYLHTGNAAVLRPVVEHNLRDLVAMLALLVRIGLLLAEREVDRLSAEELYGLGRFHEARRRWDDAIRCYRAAIDRGLSRRFRELAWWRLGCSNRRLGRWAAAVEAWAQCARLGGELAPKALREMACCAERRSDDVDRALSTIQEALDLVDRLPCREPGSLARWRLEIERRRERLLRRQLARRTRPVGRGGPFSGVAAQ